METKSKRPKRELKSVDVPKSTMFIDLDIFYGDNTMNRLMHAADVFEKGKQLATHARIKVEGSDDINTDKLCDNIKNAMESTGKNVVFVGIRNINGVRADNPKAYIKPDVQTISDGKNWGMFKDMLKQLGYKAETTKFMQVTTVTAKHNNHG